MLYFLKKHNLLFLILIIFVLSQCKSKKENTIDVLYVDVENVDDTTFISEFIDTIKYIKLETEPECLLDRISNVWIRDHYIYIQDLGSHSIFLFNKDGSYVSKFNNRGRGPDEYLYMGPVVVSEDEGFIELFTRFNSGFYKSVYSIPDFKFLSKTKIKYFSANCVRKIDDQYYFSSWGVANYIDGRQFNVGLSQLVDTSIVERYFVHETKNKRHFYFHFDDNFGKGENNEIYFTMPYDNTFYRIDEIGVKPFFEIDFGKYEIDNSKGELPVEEQFAYFESAVGKAFFPLLSLNNSNIMVINYALKNNEGKRFFTKDEIRYYIHLKDKDKIIHSKRLINDLTSFPSSIELNTSPLNRVVRDIWIDGWLIDIVMPNEYVSNKKEEIFIDEVGEISYNDNPVIVLMRLKKDVK